MTTTNEQLTAPPAYNVWGTAIPLHWLEFLTKLAEEKNMALYSMLRARMIENGLTDTDIEVMAERARIPTLSQKQQLIAKYFKADGLPAWQIPHPKPRRVMAKGRRAIREPVKGTAKKVDEMLTGSGVWVQLKPSVLDKLKAEAALRGMPPRELAGKVLTNWLKAQPDIAPITPADASPEPDQQEG